MDCIKDSSSTVKAVTVLERLKLHIRIWHVSLFFSAWGGKPCFYMYYTGAIVIIFLESIEDPECRQISSEC